MRRVASVRPLLAAPVAGFPAVVCAALLRERLRAPFAAHPDFVVQCRATLAALDEAAEQWRAWQQARAAAEADASVDGSASVAAAEAGADSVELDTAAVSARLRVTPSRVRQLLRAGVLAGRRVDRAWLVSTAAVEMYEGAR